MGTPVRVQQATGRDAAALRCAPRVHLAALPTPLRPAPRLSELLGLEVWLKRDDLTGVGPGGHLARRLEFLLGDARSWGADTVLVPVPDAASARTLPTVAAGAAAAGLACVAVTGCRGRAGRVALDLARRSGAEIVPAGSRGGARALESALAQTDGRLRAGGRRTYRLPRAGAAPVGCLGSVEAARELAAQVAGLPAAPAAEVAAVASGATLAGLLLGAAVAGDSRRLLGVAVEGAASRAPARVSALAETAGALFGHPAVAVPEVLDAPPPEAREAAATAAARAEGLYPGPRSAAALTALTALTGPAEGWAAPVGPVVVWVTDPLP